MNNFSRNSKCSVIVSLLLSMHMPLHLRGRGDGLSDHIHKRQPQSEIVNTTPVGNDSIFCFICSPIFINSIPNIAKIQKSSYLRKKLDKCVSMKSIISADMERSSWLIVPSLETP